MEEMIMAERRSRRAGASRRRTASPADVKPALRGRATLEDNLDSQEDTAGSSGVSNTEEDEYAREVYAEKPQRGFDIKRYKAPIVIGAIAVVVLIGGLSSILGEDSEPNDSENQVVEQTNPNAVYDKYGNLISENGIYDLDGEVIADNAIDPGQIDYKDGSTTADPIVYSDEDFIKELNGLDVKAKYNVASREFVYDYVSYTSKRAIIDEGMEMYWLEAEYHNKKYRIQVPFYRYQVLGDDGICRVQMEVLTLEGGGKIISYMKVADEE